MALTAGPALGARGGVGGNGKGHTGATSATHGHGHGHGKGQTAGQGKGRGHRGAANGASGAARHSAARHTARASSQVVAALGHSHGHAYGKLKGRGTKRGAVRAGAQARAATARGRGHAYGHTKGKGNVRRAALAAAAAASTASVVHGARLAADTSTTTTKAPRRGAAADRRTTRPAVRVTAARRRAALAGAAGVAGAAAAVHGAVTRLVAPVTTADAAADRAAAERAAAHRRAAARHPINQALGLAAAPARALIQIIEHIPLWLWVALVAALLFAFLTGISALLTARRARRQESMFAALSAAALTDSLTGVLNRRGFTEAVERELARARRYGHPFVLAYVDVRGLKGVNDTEGHQVGDKLLQEAAGMLQASARADDVVGRLGGDEMALLLVEQTSEAATAVTERLQSEVAARRTELALRAPWALTVGTAAYPADGETFDELLRTADHRLYEQRGIELRSGPAGQPVAG